LKLNINSYDDADDSQSNLTQLVFFLVVFAHALSCTPIFLILLVIGVLGIENTFSLLPIPNTLVE